ncbi:MAG: DUF4234 domain-containing protein [Candidatus Enteromonas sp.]
MDHYKHTRRSALLYFLLNAITLGIYGAVLFSHIRKEYQEMAKGTPNERKIGSFVAGYFLGFPTLGIYPFVLGAKLVAAVGQLAKDKGMERPRINGKFFVLWTFLGLPIIVGPFIALRRFVVVLNTLEEKENETHRLAAEAEKAREEGIATIPAATEEAVQEEPALEPDTPAIEPVAIAPTRILRPDPVKTLLAKYAACPEGRFKVRFEKGSAPVRTFAKKEDAMAFARDLAKAKDARLRYVKLK